jgi:hypothetical protein
MRMAAIDGTITLVAPAGTLGWCRFYGSVVLHNPEASSHVLRNVQANGKLIAEIREKASGRFYVFETFGIRAIVGVRMADGRSLWRFPTENTQIFAIGAGWYGYQLFKSLHAGLWPSPFDAGLTALSLVAYGTMWYVRWRLGRMFAQDRAWHEAESG